MTVCAREQKISTVTIEIIEYLPKHYVQPLLQSDTTNPPSAPFRLFVGEAIAMQEEVLSLFSTKQDHLHEPYEKILPN